MSTIVSYIEGPEVEGTRDWPIETLWEVLGDPRMALPDIGIAPSALLAAALHRRDPVSAAAESAPTLSSG